MLLQETKILEYWRQKYLKQAIFVICVALGLMVYFSFTVKALSLKLLFGMIAFAVSYLMVKELRADLQGRGENLILMKAKECFHHLKFDFGRGIEERELLEVKFFDDYKIRECRNVVIGEGFLLEEDWFYKTFSIWAIPVINTVFEGLVLVVDVSFSENKISNYQKSAEKLKKLVGAKSVRVNQNGGKIYFWFDGAKPVFYQFSLLKMNSLNAFVKHVQNLQAYVEDIKNSVCHH